MLAVEGGWGDGVCDGGSWAAGPRLHAHVGGGVPCALPNVVYVVLGKPVRAPHRRRAPCCCFWFFLVTISLEPPTPHSQAPRKAPHSQAQPGTVPARMPSSPAGRRPAIAAAAGAPARRALGVAGGGARRPSGARGYARSGASGRWRWATGSGGRRGKKPGKRQEATRPRPRLAPLLGGHFRWPLLLAPLALVRVGTGSFYLVRLCKENVGVVGARAHDAR